MMKPTLVILAAGMGSRYGGNKQTDAFGPSGETIMEYTIYDAIKAGFGKIVFVIKKGMKDTFEPEIKEKVGDRIDMAFVYQELDVLPEGLSVPEGREKPWGTGHALWVAHEEVNEPFSMANADDFYGFDGMKTMVDALNKLDDSKIGGCIVGYKLSNTLSDHGSVNRGVCQTEDGYLTGIKECIGITKDGDSVYYMEEDEKIILTGDEPVSMNLMGYTTPVFDMMEEGFTEFFKEKSHLPKSEYLTPQIFQDMMDQGVKIPVPETSSSWFGVTYREDKPIVIEKLNKLVEAGEYPSNLWE
jgi:NDP-sugar pyrophosphorylase family protein